MRADLKQFLIDMKEKGASDLHITSHYKMHYRIDDELLPVNDKTLSPEEVKDVVYSMMEDDLIERFEREKECEFSFSIEGIGRYRVNVFLQRSNVGCAIRLIPLKIMTISECGLPENVIIEACKQKRGLILVVGATGSGKSTSLAAMIDQINKTRRDHIVTVEDPIEYVHVNKKAIIDQREVFSDTFSFGNALRHVLRQDPDVIMVGELRDLETIQQALIIADTGHLVLGTLHTPGAIQTINRIVDVFPPHHQKQIRTQLSFVLKVIIAQQLVPLKDGNGRVIATEILVNNPAVSSMMRDEKEHQIYSIIQTSQKVGMKTMNQSLVDLYAAGIISYEEAFARCTDQEEFVKLIGK